MEREDMAPVMDFCASHQISYSFISNLNDAGIIEVLEIEEQRYLRTDQLSDLEKLIRMHTELDINAEGVEAIAHLLQRLHQMQADLTLVRQRLSLYE